MPASLVTRGNDDIRVARINNEFINTRMLVNIENQIPCCAAVSGSVEPPLATVTPQRPLRGNQHLVGIVRIDPDLADVTRGFETHIFP